MASQVKTSGKAPFSLRTICDALGSLSHKSSQIGVQLGIPLNKLEQLKGGDPLAKIIDYWLSGNVEKCRPCNWESVVAALRSDHVDEAGKATEIEKKYVHQNPEVSWPNLPEGKILELPYLNVKHLSEEDKDELIARLQLESKKINMKFTGLVTKALMLVEKSGAAESTATKSFFFECGIHELADSIAPNDSVPIVINKVREYKPWSFFDYELFETFVEAFCNDQSFVLVLENYKLSFKKYCERRLDEVPKECFKLNLNIHSESKICMKIDKLFFGKHVDIQHLLSRKDNSEEMAVISLLDIKELQIQLSSLLNIKHLVLLSIEMGCVELTFRHYEKINPLSLLSVPKQIILALTGVKKIWCNSIVYDLEECIYPPQLTHEDEIKSLHVSDEKSWDISEFETMEESLSQIKKTCTESFKKRIAECQQSIDDPLLSNWMKEKLKKGVMLYRKYIKEVQENIDSQILSLRKKFDKLDWLKAKEHVSQKDKIDDDYDSAYGSDTDINEIPVGEEIVSDQEVPINADDLLEIIQSGNITKLKLLLSKPKIGTKLNLLHAVTQYKQLKMLKVLIEEFGYNPSSFDDKGLTPLHVASKVGALKIIKYLINDQRLNPYTKDYSGYLPVHYACLNNHLDSMKYLMELTCKYTRLEDLLSEFTKEGLALIHIASFSGHLSIMKYLVEEYKCELILLTKEGHTPLYIASEKGHLKIVKYLVETRGCNPTTDNHSISTPLHVAAINGHHAVVQYLVEQCHCDPTVEGPLNHNCLHGACDSGHVDIVKYLIEERGMDPCKRVGKTKTSCLHLAAKKGRQLVIEYLSNIKKMKDFMLFGDDDEFTPLHLAAQNNHVMALKFFIENHHIPPYLQTSEGVTPLLLAEKNLSQNRDAIAYLETQFRGPKLSDYSLLQHYIALGFSLELIKSEASKYKTCDNPNTFGQTPLHFAAHRGQLDVVKYLIEEKSCNPHKKDSAGFTSLHMAAEGGSLEVVEYLMTQHHCDPTAVSYGGSNFDSTPTHQKTTPLHAAAEHGHIQIVKFILLQTEYPVDPEVRSHLGLTPLLFAAKEGELDIVKYLITKHRCNPLHQDVNLNTAIHHATTFGRLKVLKYLVKDLKLRADLENAEQMQPIHIAAIQGDLKMLKFYLGVLKIDSNMPMVLD